MFDKFRSTLFSRSDWARRFHFYSSVFSCLNLVWLNGLFLSLSKSLIYTQFMKINARDSNCDDYLMKMIQNWHVIRISMMSIFYKMISCQLSHICSDFIQLDLLFIGILNEFAASLLELQSKIAYTSINCAAFSNWHK